MKNSKKELELGSVSFITKLAGFEHTEYIKPNATKAKINSDDVPMYIGMNIKNGRLTNEISWFLPKKISMQLHRSALTKKCLVLPYVGSVGDVAVFDSNERHHLASNVAKIELIDDAPFSPEYLYYFLKSPFGQRKLLFYIQGGVQKNITMDAIRKTIIPIQDNANKIVQILSDLDSKIELNNRINTELESMAKTLYDYWFVQFDFPDKNGKSYKTSGGKIIWNEELKREIPEGWEVKKISEIAQFVNGKGINKELLSNSGKYPVYGSNGITGYTNEILFSEPVIAIGRVGANYGEVHYSLNSCWISDNAVTAQPKNAFYLWWLMDTLKRIDYKKIAGGSAQPLITQGQLKDLKFVIPNDTFFQKFDEIVNPIYLQLNLNIVQNQKLTELRDWLLPMLMNGQVTVN